VSEVAATPLPGRGRIWVLLALVLALGALGYAVVGIATKKAGRAPVRIEGISTAQATFGGIPQEGDRLGSSDAPVSIQVFADLQCGNCRDNFLETMPALAERYARPGDAKLLLRHYSVAENPLEKGFFGAEAAAQQGYGWQYTDLFFVNQDEAERTQVSDDFLESLASSVGELDLPEWRQDFEKATASGSAIKRQLEGYEELGTKLGIRTQMATIVDGPRGVRTLQDAPDLAQIESAITAVE
jgi:protein-disulfide isomerase